MTIVSPTSTLAPPSALAHARPSVRGKFLFLGDTKWYVRGVTYGTFRPDADGAEYPPVEVIERDFAMMAANGINAVRTYTAPPIALLDVAARHGLRVMIGLTAERYVGYLTDPAGAPDFEAAVREQARRFAGHPALLGYAIGNEIPSPTVRWLGRGRVERFLDRLARAVKAEDPAALVTYVNYPSTEYLRTPFADFMCFNVYLESRERLEAYLARLQNLAGERPLVMAEIGLDSLRNGPETQADVLRWQVRSAFASGCAGLFVYAWTDEWHRGGEDVLDWEFGLTRRDRTAKPALGAVSSAFAEAPLQLDRWPRISVVVCSYNGARTLRDCMEGLARLEYPDHEVIVVDDGSLDQVSSIAQEYCTRVIRTENRGLSSARNTGWQAATGEIVAYTDDDARPDPHWLTYLAYAFTTSEHAGIGGPNIAPAGDGSIADCVANAPGGPVHVLISDRLAEHIPGCNMAFRKSALAALGGFDPIFRVAGDDVDLCWRLQDQGGTIGFHAGAMVWHRRRNSVRTYWRQQQGYGKAEALLERKWPERYNAAGHLSWAGRLYGRGPTRAIALGRGRIYQGPWGTAPYQLLYEPTPGLLASLALMPEWYLAVVGLGIVSLLGLSWPPLLWAIPLLIAAVAAPIAQAVLSAARAEFPGAPSDGGHRLRLHALTALLHVIQPIARLKGRLAHGLSPWRRRGEPAFVLPRPRREAIWSERWHAPADRLRRLYEILRAANAIVARGGDYDRWDLEVRGGLFGSARLLMAVEEHGGGRQLVRARSWPRAARFGAMLTIALAGLSAAAAAVHAAPAAGGLAAIAALGGLRTLWECGQAQGLLVQAIGRMAQEER